MIRLIFFVFVMSFPAFSNELTRSRLISFVTTAFNSALPNPKLVGLILWPARHAFEEFLQEKHERISALLKNLDRTDEEQKELADLLEAQGLESESESDQSQESNSKPQTNQIYLSQIAIHMALGSDTSSSSSSSSSREPPPEDVAAIREQAGSPATCAICCQTPRSPVQAILGSSVVYCRNCLSRWYDRSSINPETGLATSGSGSEERPIIQVGSTLWSTTITSPCSYDDAKDLMPQTLPAISGYEAYQPQLPSLQELQALSDSLNRFGLAADLNGWLWTSDAHPEGGQIIFNIQEREEGYTGQSQVFPRARYVLRLVPGTDDHAPYARIRHTRQPPPAAQLKPNCGCCNML